MHRFQEAAALSSSDAKLVSKSMAMDVTLGNSPQSALQPKRPKEGNSKGGSQEPSPQGGPAPIFCNGTGG